MRLYLLTLLLIPVLCFGQEPNDPPNLGKDAVKRKSLIPGAYRSYQDFRNNSPSEVGGIDVEKEPRTKEPWKGTYEIKARYASSGKKVKRVWGFSDGETAYIWHQTEFFPMDVVDNELVFIAYDLIEDKDAVAVGVAVGTIGGSIYSFVQLSKAKENKTRYVIDDAVGTALHPIYGYSQERISETERDLVVYRRKKKERETPAEFIVGDSLKYSFEMDSNVRLRFSQSQKTVKVCAGQNRDECVEVVLENNATHYIKLEYLAESESPKLVPVTESKGEFNYYKTVKPQEKRGAQVAEKL